MVSRTSTRKWVSLFTAVLMVFSLALPALAANNGSDIQGHWAEDEMLEWIEQGFLKGFTDGTFRPNQEITRAEFMALVNRTFGFTEKANVNFKDVPSISTAWYVNDVARAVAAGYIQGFQDGTIRPNDPITRQEVAAIVARILDLELVVNQELLKQFVDANRFATWSLEEISAVVANGYMQGTGEKMFEPFRNITRAEAVATLDRVIKDHFFIFNKAGTYGPTTGVNTINGNVMISVPGVTLKNTIITGDLLLGVGIGDGDVYLDGVIVQGNTTVQGGGKNSIHIINSKLFTVIVDRESGTVRIVVSGTSSIDDVTLYTDAIIVEEDLEGVGFGNISVKITEDGQVILSGDFENVEIDVPNVSVILESGSINNLLVTENAENSTVELGEGTSVSEMTLNSNTSVTGEGTIENAIVNADGTSFEQAPKSLQLADGVTTEVGGETVDQSYGSSGGSGTSGGGAIGGGPSIVLATGISVSGKDGATAVVKGNTLQMNATVTPNNATNKAVTWSVDDTDTATIDANGLLTAINEGEVTVKAVAKDGSNVSGEMKVNVIAQPRIEDAYADVIDGSIGVYEIKGYVANFKLDQTTLGDAESLEVALYNGDTLLQKNSATTKLFDDFPEETDITTYFDIFGNYDYETDGFWNTDGWKGNVAAIPTKVVVTILHKYTKTQFELESNDIRGDADDLKKYYPIKTSATIVVDSDTVKGYSVQFEFNGKKVSDATSIEVSLYEGNTLLQKNIATENLFTKYPDSTVLSTAFDIFGTYKDTGSSSWSMSGWLGSVGAIPTKTVVSVKFSDMEIDYVYMGIGGDWHPSILEKYLPKEVSNVYEIETPGELLWVASSVNSGKDQFKNKTIRLLNDIDLSGYVWTPIGTSTYKFQGTFDGNNKTISNLKGPNGLIGYAEPGVTVQNVVIEFATIEGSGSVAAIVGQGGAGTVTITNSKVSKSIIKGTGNYVGGIGGNGYFSVSNSHVEDSTIEGDGISVGGLIGFQGEGAFIISDSTVTNTNVSGYFRTGGLVGLLQYGNTVANSHVYGGVITSRPYEGSDPSLHGFIIKTGGFIGDVHTTNADVTISNSSTTATLGGDSTLYNSTVGKFIGNVDDGPGGRLIVENCLENGNPINYVLVSTVDELEKSINAASDGDEIRIRQGNYTITDTIIINKAVILKGAEGFSTQINTSGGQPVFRINAAATIDGLYIYKTDKTNQHLITITANNAKVLNSKFMGQYQQGDNETSRAIVPNSGVTGYLLDGNHFENLRQPAYLQGAGTVSNNFLKNTRGWVVTENYLVVFVNNSFEGNAVDIAIISNNVPAANNYPDVASISAANNGAFVENQVSGYSAINGKQYIGNTTTLLNAIANANDGDVLELAPATFTITQTLHTNKPISIVGYDQNRTILDVKGVPNGAWGVLINKSNTTISNLTIFSNKTANYNNNLKVSDEGNTPIGHLTNVVIQNVNIQGGKGLDIHNADVVVDNVSIKDSLGASIAISNGSNVTITNTTTTNGAWGSLGVMHKSGYEKSTVLIGSGNSFNEEYLYTEEYPTIKNTISGLDSTWVSYINERNQLVYTKQLPVGAYKTSNNGDKYYYATVQEAIDSASDGDTIELVKGTYSGFTVNKEVTILGNGSEITSGIKIDADNVTVDGLNVTPSTLPGVDSGDIGYGIISGSNITIKNGIIKGTGAIGSKGIVFAISSGAKAHIENVTFSNLYNGVVVNKQSVSATNNIFINVTYGIGSTEDSILGLIENNQFILGTEGIGLGDGVKSSVPGVNEENLVDYLLNNNTFNNYAAGTEVVDYRTNMTMLSIFSDEVFDEEDEDNNEDGIDSITDEDFIRDEDENVEEEVETDKEDDGDSSDEDMGDENLGDEDMDDANSGSDETNSASEDSDDES